METFKVKSQSLVACHCKQKSVASFSFRTDTNTIGREDDARGDCQSISVSAKTVNP